MRLDAGWLLLSSLVALPALAQVDAGVPPFAGDRRLDCVRKLARVAGINWRTALAELGPDRAPQSKIDDWLSPSRDSVGQDYAAQGFSRSFGAFYARKVNRAPSASPHEGLYAWAVGWVLHNELRFQSLFTGRLSCNDGGARIVNCVADERLPPIGIYNSELWWKIYLGAAPDGLILRGAYNIVKATTGRVLVPSADNMIGDVSAVGRQRPACRGCHFEGPVPLDTIATLLPYRKHPNGRDRQAQTPTPGRVLDGQMVGSLAELTARLADSDEFRAWTCQLAFEYALGRPPRACERPLFDACTTELQRSGQLRAALKPLLTDPSFCAEGQ